MWDYSLFWDEAMNQAQAELGEHEFGLWFNIKYSCSTDSSITIKVPSKFYRDQFSKKYQLFMEDKLFELSGQEIKLEYEIVKPENPSSSQTRTASTAAAPAERLSAGEAQPGAENPAPGPAPAAGREPDLKENSCFSYHYQIIIILFFLIFIIKLISCFHPILDLRLPSATPRRPRPAHRLHDAQSHAGSAAHRYRRQRPRSRL